MPDILIISSDQNFLSSVEATARGHGIRVKTAFDRAGALDWLSTWDFHAIVAHHEISLTDQEQIAAALWKQNQFARFIVVDSRPQSARQVDQRLFGAEVLRAENLETAFKELAQHIKDSSSFNPASFPIMVVEDLDSPRDIICAFVESMGFPRVIGHRSVRDALNQLVSDPACCSCIITDIRMPDLGGEYLIEQVRKHQKLQHLPVIVLTAYGSADMLIGCLKAGASGFLVKPPKRDDLLREIGRASRILMQRRSPRLASADEIEQVSEALERRGLL